MVSANGCFYDGVDIWAMEVLMRMHEKVHQIRAYGIQKLSKKIIHFLINNFQQNGIKSIWSNLSLFGINFQID